MKLIQKKCVPCEGGTPPLTTDKVAELKKQLDSDWRIKDNKKIFFEFKFPNFIQAIKFVNAVADLAEQEGHHPDITINYNRVRLELWTHAISGLSENDFILAAKIEKLKN